ncbi:MAG: hypothetical protein ACQESW_10045 [Bacteroidota bacterium]
MKSSTKIVLLLIFSLIFIFGLQAQASQTNRNNTKKELKETVATEQTSQQASSGDTTKSNTSEAATNNEITEEPEHGSNFSWFNFIVGFSYIIGIFILFPLVIYTNLNEKTVDANASDEHIREDITPEEREGLAEEILVEMEARLTDITEPEDDQTYYTITKGRQARFVKRGLDYIHTRLAPTDEDVISQVEGFEELYKNRVHRKYSGSNLLMGCAIGVLIFMALMDISFLLTPFAWIHMSGIVFYFLSSRAPVYALEKREQYLGSTKLGFIGTLVKPIVGALIAGMSIKHYVSVNGGPWKRDHDSELGNSAFLIVIIALIMLVLGFFIAFFGILNFILNYSTSALIPFRSLDKWYSEHFIATSEVSVA